MVVERGKTFRGLCLYGAVCRLDRQDDAGGISRKAMKGFLSKLERLVWNFVMLMLLKQNGEFLEFKTHNNPKSIFNGGWMGVGKVPSIFIYEDTLG